MHRNLAGIWIGDSSNKKELVTLMHGKYYYIDQDDKIHNDLPEPDTIPLTIKAVFQRDVNCIYLTSSRGYYRDLKHDNEYFKSYFLPKVHKNELIVGNTQFMFERINKEEIKLCAKYYPILFESSLEDIDEIILKLNELNKEPYLICKNSFPKSSKDLKFEEKHCYIGYDKEIDLIYISENKNSEETSSFPTWIKFVKSTVSIEKPCQLLLGQTIFTINFEIMEY